MKFFGYLIRYDELALKGRNRRFFENQLISNIGLKLSSLGYPTSGRPTSGHSTRGDGALLKRLWGRLLLTIERHSQIEESLKQIFGISSISPVVRMDAAGPQNTQECLRYIKEGALSLILSSLETNKNQSFRVRANRVDKRFMPPSPDINKEISEYILREIPTLSVNLNNAEIDLGIDIRQEGIFLFLERMEGLRGLPVGSGSRVLALLSGGIDSPVAAWSMMKRGCPVDFVHFFSYPYTAIQGKEKVIDLARHVTRYQNSAILYVVSFTKIQEEIQKHCRERFRTLLYRRFMQRIATGIANARGASALVTGESVGQVASQTLENILAIGQSTDVLVLRPLIAFNKQETIEIAKKIGTYDISIRPFDDCCTIFQAKEPATKSRVNDLVFEEKKIPFEEKLIEEAIANVEMISL